jgi:hypothetical protein
MIAEKVEAIVKLGIVNSRMKDFYDVIIISEDFELVAGVLTEAIRATFTRRGTPLPTETPIGLTDEFAADKHVAWKAFLRTNDLQDVPEDLSATITRVRAFICPVVNLRPMTEDDFFRQNPLCSRAEIVAKPCPVPGSSGVYAWFFREIPP